MGTPVRIAGIRTLPFDPHNLALDLERTYHETFELFLIFLSAVWSRITTPRKIGANPAFPYTFRDLRAGFAREAK